MKITFISKIFQNEEEFEIKFKSAVEISEYNEFKVYEFKEPEHGVMNRLEVSPEAVNIFAGVATIQLELKKQVKIQYQTPSGILFLNSFLENISIKENDVNFTYTLSKENDEIGKYTISTFVK